MVNNTVQQNLVDENIQEQNYDILLNFGVLNPNMNSVFADQVSVFKKEKLTISYNILKERLTISYDINF